MLEQCCNHSKQCRNNVATLCCAKNRRCESSRVASPLHQETMTLVYTKCSIGNMMKISRYLQGALTIIIFFLVIFAGMALKLEKLAQPFHFQSMSFLAILATDYVQIICPVFGLKLILTKTTSRRREILFQTQNGLK